MPVVLSIRMVNRLQQTCQPVRVEESEGRGAAVGLPEGHDDLLAEVKATVAAARRRAQRVVNTELLLM